MENNNEAYFKERITWDETTGAEYLDTLETKGRKGLHLKRINMAFSPENYTYIKTMSKACGQTATQFVNDVLAKSRENNADAYNQVKDFKASIK